MNTISDEEYESLLDTFRGAALEGIDAAMNEVCRRMATSPGRNDIGARDADLPRLVKALDRQFEDNMILLGFERESYAMDKAEQRWTSQ